MNFCETNCYNLGDAYFRCSQECKMSFFWVSHFHICCQHFHKRAFDPKPTVLFSCQIGVRSVESIYRGVLQGGKAKCFAYFNKQGSDGLGDC